MMSKELEQSSFVVADQFMEKVNFFTQEMGLYDWKEDVIQESIFGLWEACRTFDAGEGEFSLFAEANMKRWIGINLHRQQSPPHFISQQLVPMLETNNESQQNMFIRHAIQRRFLVNQWKWLYGHILLNDWLLNNYHRGAG
ncbi:hypothetical protein FH966_00290 [Lentibacillus cibarius]|uniref:RNA polymerase sigma-70 region 2 domain-containing protein n=1 Tax=Lentibacillus cibarius TaxID=2583219 RepID=A0A549YEG4_9BACI|nr:sigma factor [Lentibacillus cibarius]TMN21401.1 hypothetical protein FFL34_04205 [Lentibacillus cibarius]TRM10280.1 hypothetical protein FH966_00290 [Lentibacillus cibarius]